MTRALVIFDVDGTLIDSQDHIVAAMCFAFAEAGVEPPAREAILAIVGLSLAEAMAVLVPHCAVDLRARLADSYRAAFGPGRAAIEGEAPLFDGARGLLDRLAARGDTALGIATGKARRGVERLYRAHGLGGHFATAQTADDHPSKPHPSMIHRAMAETGAAPGNTVMIGDTEFDIAMGRAAGVTAIGVTWGYHPVARLQAAGADLLVDSFDDLAMALDGLLSREAGHASAGLD